MEKPRFWPRGFFFSGFNYSGLEKTLLQSGSGLFSVGWFVLGLDRNLAFGGGGWLVRPWKKAVRAWRE
jgi:hypothetical protein